MKRILIQLCLLLAAATGLPAAPQGVSFIIRYYEKRIYYLNDSEHPIRLEAIVENNSADVYRFQMADNDFYNVDFEVSTPTNILLDHSEAFKRSRLANQPVLYRDVSLQPGQQLGFVVNLSDFVAFEKAGFYTVVGLFYPDLNVDGPGEPLRSAGLPLNVRPAVVFPEEKAMIEAETGKLLARESLPPDQVVAYTLTARQKSQWEKFFLYLDLESLYLRNPARAARYRRMSEEDRRAALAQYREQLKNELVDTDILLIPSSFEILRTEYTQQEGQVEVVERFRYRDYTEIRRYTYYLQRQEGIWLITGYDVVNLGTE